MTLTELQYRNLSNEYDDHMHLKKQRNNYKRQVKILSKKLKDLHYDHDEEIKHLWARIDYLENMIKHQ